MPNGPYKAKLLFAAPEPFLSRVETAVLSEQIEALGFEIAAVTEVAGASISFELRDLHLRLGYRAAPVPLRLMREVIANAPDDAARERALGVVARHRANVSIAVSDRAAVPFQTGEAKRHILWEALDYVMGICEPDMVLTPGLNPQQDRLLNAAETRDWLRDLDERAVRINDLAANPRVHRKSILREEPALSNRAAEWLMPDEAGGETGDRRGFSTATDGEGPQDGDDDGVGKTPAGRSALYVMSATIGIYALPLGASALAYNALSGGSFRLTSHAMAATGVFSAVDSTGVPRDVLRFFGLV
ncbi:MAG: hypothetical protein AAGG54_12215 [Pseudomonadota bacterium]